MKKLTFYAVLFFTTHNLCNTTPQIENSLRSTLFDEEIGAQEIDEATLRAKRPAKKPWTIIIYMAADNDLRNFATRNLKQMASIGSTEHINIVAHLDIRISGNKKTTRRYYIEKDRILHVNAADGDDFAMDSGDPATLVSCCTWAMQNYPAQDYALIFWNHGAGIIDPERGRIINPAELFSFNQSTNRLELDRSIGFLEYIAECEKATDQRGICWDETTGNYLTNQKLEKALQEICTKQLNGKKLSIIGFDACLMSMVEVGLLVQPYADIMVGSQEVELGTGWNYSHALSPFTQQTINKYEFAAHIVDAYEKTYKSITSDYTQSAVDLNKLNIVDRNIHDVAKLLLDGAAQQTNNSIKSAVREARKKNNCTHFDEPSYIDLHHFYRNLYGQLSNMTLQNSNAEIEFKKNLKYLLEKGMGAIIDAVFANATGPNLNQAKGLSIYFPERKTHSSYSITGFARNNAWATLIGHYTEPHRDVSEFFDAFATC